MDDSLQAYEVGRADAGAGCRDVARAADARTGADYRIGFLDGRIELFHMFAEVRRILDDRP
jgi:hypothetical protein